MYGGCKKILSNMNTDKGKLEDNNDAGEEDKLHLNDGTSNEENQHNHF